MNLWRRLGADLPFGDPRRAHGVPMEGYYWRFVEPDSGRVVVALCGVTRSGGESRALVAVALHPEGRVVTRDVDRVWTDPATLGIDAGPTFAASTGRLRLDLGSVQLEADIAGRPWPRRALGGLGLAGTIPGLSQYWHPHVLGAPATATLTIDGAREHLAPLVYAEKNWGRGFPRRWWWGEAHDDEVTTAFAGGTLEFGPASIPATTAVVILGDRAVRMVAPTALVRFETAPGEWRITARSARHTLTMQGSTGHAPAFALPIPPRHPGVPAGTVDQHLDGTLHIRLHTGRRLILDRELSPAGLEAGNPVPLK
jgi:tocopherol cyclase